MVSSSRVPLDMWATILTAVGYNPYRKYRANKADYVMVVSAVVAALALFGWAVLG